MVRGHRIREKWPPILGANIEEIKIVSWPPSLLQYETLILIVGVGVGGDRVLQRHKFWFIWSISPSVFPWLSSSLSPSYANQHFPSTSSIWDMIGAPFDTSLSQNVWYSFPNRSVFLGTLIQPGQYYSINQSWFHQYMTSSLEHNFACSGH